MGKLGEFSSLLQRKQENSPPDCSTLAHMQILQGTSQNTSSITRVTGLYEDDQITYEVKCTVARMLRRGVPRRQVVEETSALYGIPEECVEEVVAAVPA